MGAVIVIMVPIYLLLKIFGCLRNQSEFLNHLRSTVALKNMPKKFSVQRIFSKETKETTFLNPGSVSNLIQKNFDEPIFEMVSKNNFLRSQKENCEPMAENEIRTDLKINKEKNEAKEVEAVEEVLHVKGIFYLLYELF